MKACPAQGTQAEAQIVFSDALAHRAARPAAVAQWKRIRPCLPARAEDRELGFALPLHGQIDHGDLLLKRVLAQRDGQAQRGLNRQAGIRVPAKGIQARGAAPMAGRDALEVVARVFGHSAGEGVDGNRCHAVSQKG